MRFFNTEGPIKPEMHYFIPHRLDISELLDLIEKQKYFVLHAPRQSGKTTAIQEVARTLNALGKYSGVYVNIENAQAARNNVKEALITVIQKIKYAIQESLGDEEKTLEYLDSIVKLRSEATLNILELALATWATHSQKPIVLFIDEIDSLIGDSLISVLRQIRSGYQARPLGFPQSICLIGLRDVKDYRVWSEENGMYISTSSPFNIKAKSLTLSNFTPEQVAELYEQHTKETGQIFEHEAIEYAFSLTQGQPWLVNALAFEAAFADVTNRDQPITKSVIERAKNVLIQRRDTHLDSLIEKLREKRVLPIIDAVINGQTNSIDFDTDSVRYVRDLGLLKATRMEIANPIYQEIIPRELTAIAAEGFAEKFLLRPGYVRNDGSLNMTALLEAFAEFYRENSAIWLEKFAYKESGPHLLLMAFLQRIINGGGTLSREYALGRGRVDILIQWQKQRIVVELKVKRGDKSESEGLEQTANYMETSQASEGHLFIFDRNSEIPWQEKFSHSQKMGLNHPIDVWRL